jgi:Serine carboxypeptidase S28
MLLSLILSYLTIFHIAIRAQDIYPWVPRQFSHRARKFEVIIWLDLQAHTMPIPVDHFSPDCNETYNNYYWINDTYHLPNGPVFFIDHGEAGINESSISYFLQESTGPTAVMTLARKYHGLVILFEHRYYGQNLPVDMNPKTGFPKEGVEVYRFLNPEQALEDTVYSAKTSNYLD